MTNKTKNTLVVAGVVLLGVLIIRKVRSSQTMVTDENTGLLGLNLFGIL